MAKVIQYIVFIFFMLINVVAISQETKQKNQAKLLPDSSYINVEDSSFKVHAGYYYNAFPDISIKDIDVALRFWSEEVAKESGVNGTVSIYDNLDKMKLAFYQKKLDFIAASPLIFVNHFDLKLLKGGFKTHPYGQPQDKLLIVTHKQSNLDHFKKLNNSQLTLLKNDPVSAMYINTLALEHFGKKAKQVFSTIDSTNKSSLLIYNLFFRKTDIILVYETNYLLAVELNPQIKIQTQIIAELDNIPRGLIFFHQKVDPEIRERIINISTTLDNSPRLQQLLALFKSKKLVRSTLGDLKTTIQLKQKYLRLIKQYGFSQ